MGVNTQESFTKSDETSSVQNPIGVQVMQLESIGVQQAMNKRMQWKSKPAREESLKAYPLIRRRSRNWLIPRDTHVASHHHAISNQRTQICGPESGPLPLAGHLG